MCPTFPLHIFFMKARALNYFTPTQRSPLATMVPISFLRIHWITWRLKLSARNLLQGWFPSSRRGGEFRHRCLDTRTPNRSRFRSFLFRASWAGHRVSSRQHFHHRRKGRHHHRCFHIENKHGIGNGQQVESATANGVPEALMRDSFQHKPGSLGLRWWKRYRTPKSPQTVRAVQFKIN